MQACSGALQEAAKQLGVGLSVLKRICRQKGLARWPFRTRQSLRGVIARTEEYYKASGGDSLQCLQMDCMLDLRPAQYQPQHSHCS